MSVGVLKVAADYFNAQKAEIAQAADPGVFLDGLGAIWERTWHQPRAFEFTNDIGDRSTLEHSRSFDFKENELLWGEIIVGDQHSVLFELADGVAHSHPSSWSSDRYEFFSIVDHLILVRHRREIKVFVLVCFRCVVMYVKGEQADNSELAIKRWLYALRNQLNGIRTSLYAKQMLGRYLLLTGFKRFKGEWDSETINLSAV